MQGWVYTGNTYHPTQKPVFNLKLLIDTYCREGGLVLDPFAGSGSTLVAAKDRIDETQTANQYQPSGYGTLDLLGYWQLSEEVGVNGGLYNLTDKKYWQWDDVRGYDNVGEASVTQPANLDRLTQPGRNFAVNLVWDI